MTPLFIGTGIKLGAPTLIPDGTDIDTFGAATTALIEAFAENAGTAYGPYGPYVGNGNSFSSLL